MKMSFKFLLLSTAVYVSLNTFPVAYAIPEDEQPQPQVLKRALQEGNPAKRVRKTAQGAAAEQGNGSARRASAKGGQASKRQKVQNDAPMDLSTCKALKAAWEFSGPKNKKLVKDALQKMADDINHPEHAKAVKFALDKKIMKPDIALNKFQAILASNTAALDQKEVALVYLINHKSHHHTLGVKWLDEIINATPAADPNRHRLGLLYFREVPYQARSVYRAALQYSVRGRGQDTLLEILKDPNHPLFMEACRKAFIGRVYFADKYNEFDETYPPALRALQEKASDPMDPDHLEALLALIIGNDKDSLISSEECMSELVLGHLKPLWTPDHPQYVRITEYLFFYGDEDSKKEAFPILLDNIRKGNYTKELKKASGHRMPGSDLQNTQIKQAFADSKKRPQNQNLAEEEAQPEVSPPQPTAALFEDSLMNQLTLCLNQPPRKIKMGLNAGREACDSLSGRKPGLTYSVLMAEANNEEERALQKKVYEIIRQDLHSKLGIKDFYLISKKFGDSKEFISALKTRINKSQEALDKNKTMTSSGYNSLLKQAQWKDKWDDVREFTKQNTELDTLLEPLTDPEEKQLLVTLSQYGALIKAYESWKRYRTHGHYNPFWIISNLKAVESLAESNSPYALEALAILVNTFERDISDGKYKAEKYKAAYRRIIESPEHPERVKALLNYALIDREYAQKIYLPLIEKLFHTTDERRDPRLKNDTAAIAHFLETTDPALIGWRQAQTPFNEEGVFQDNFPTHFPHLWVDLHPKALSNFNSCHAEYCETILHIPSENLEKFLETAALTSFKKKVQEVLPELNSLVDSGNFPQFKLHSLWYEAFSRSTPKALMDYALSLKTELMTRLFQNAFNTVLPELHSLADAGNFQQLWQHSIWKDASDPWAPKEIKEYTRRLRAELDTKVFDKALERNLPELDNLASPPFTREKISAFLSHNLWNYGLNSKLKSIHLKTVRTFVDKLPELTNFRVRTKFLEEAPQQLPLLEWEDSLVKDRIMSLITRINKEDKKHPEFYGLRSLLDYKKDKKEDRDKNGSWKKSKYRWDEKTKSPKTKAQGWDLLARQTEATLKKLLNIPLTKAETLVASPYNISDEDKPQFINSFKHAIEYMEGMNDPSLRNVTLGMIVRALLFCDTGQAEGINSAILNLVFKKQRLSSDFSHQLAGVMHEVVVGAFDLASAQPMPGQTAHGTHFQGQLREALHPHIGLPQVIAGHIEGYNKFTTVPYLLNLIIHFERQMTTKYTIDTLLKRANDDKKFNYGLLGDIQVWLDSMNKQFSHYGFNEEEPEKIKLIPELLIDYLIDKGWLKESALQGYHAPQLPGYINLIVAPAIPVGHQPPAGQAQNPAVEGQNPAGQVQDPAAQAQNLGDQAQ